MIPERFNSEICNLVREIPAGRVVTYGRIARLLGYPQQARRVGRAMASAPAGTPCHRVVGSGGRLVASWPAQRALLEAEGVVFRPSGCVDLGQSEWEAVRELTEQSK